MGSFDETEKNERPDIRQRLAAQGKELRDAYDQSPEGQEENIRKYKSWAFKEDRKCLDSVFTIIQWVDEKGRPRSSHFPGIGTGGGSISANAVRRSNHRSRRRRLEKLRELIAICDVMLSYFAAHRPLPENYLETLDDALTAIPDEDVLEEIVPKAGK